ncbi:Uncharacterized conserved protein YbjT, contains NAD(P)-binding and DUF2867 domains [Paraburkholderia steynii]|uniref:Uncharacterized conserved protein YbjT, contains NAD(P)-binding and DUF2867 domains n=1 Tax=Paraburkholderia steynii TaxID=1245441 RepID=A0A7Z7BBI1_9BURK|nr:NmrA family NAD(P)-binding protein [Paraburkholderia steynii]SDI56003.1 Uncharacterized conserved protein YbjT, contains NAD(P)-binding and DUF2867 domains [Paraburkholderia steynii]
MTILVTGSTGTIGSHIVNHLASESVSVRALVRSDKPTAFPAGVEKVIGDMTDLDSMRAALKGVDTLFLLNAVVPDELTQALLTLDLAVEAGIQRIVYFSAFNADLFVDVPHFTAKHAVEQAIAKRAIPASVLRPAYFFQNDAMLKEAILNYGTYPMPIGAMGVAMVDARDIAAVAAKELLRRERASAPLPRNVIEIVGAEALRGEDLARIWSEVVGKTVSYAGDDLDALETMMGSFAPKWQARDARIMFRAFQKFGMLPEPASQLVLTDILDTPARTYAAFARETAESWRVQG